MENLTTQQDKERWFLARKMIVGTNCHPAMSHEYIRAWLADIADDDYRRDMNRRLTTMRENNG